MTFQAYESSMEDGRPVTLYRFTLGTTVWRYTSHDRDVLLPDGTVWKSVAISDEGIKQSGEAASDAMNISAPITIGPVQAHLVTPPSQAIQVVILRKHVDSDDVTAAWAGEVMQVNPAVPGQARITCETTAVSMRREGLRLAWQRTCPYALYDSVTCKVNKAGYALPLIVLERAGFSIRTNVAESMPDGWFGGGFIQWMHPVRGMEFRGINYHKGNTLGIFGAVEDIYNGLRVTAYPGCSRTAAVCASKFNNLDNYGGVPNMPGKSPFDGNPVFY